MKKSIRSTGPARNPQAVVDALPSLVSMSRPPIDPLERDKIGEQVWNGILRRFVERLSERDRSVWTNPPARPEESPKHLRLLHGFDDFLLCQFAEWGWRLFTSAGVLHRISEWEKHDPVLLERLGKELGLRSKVLRGEKCAPLGEDIDKFADPTIKELKILLRQQQLHLGNKGKAVSCETIALWIRSEVAAHPTKFPRLRANLEQLCGFIHNLPKNNQRAAHKFERGDMRENSFFYLWYASCSNRSVKDVRNQISRSRAAHRST